MNGILAARSRCLPDELMAEVFLNCLEPDDIGCITPSSTSAPLVLSWVCHHWRQICLSTPKLWSGISLQDLTQDGLFAKDRRALLGLLDLWISRSGSRPISIKFSYMDLSEDERGRMILFQPEHADNSRYMRDVRTLIGRLLVCQHRWRALDMSVIDLTVVAPLLEAISSRPASPLLEHLSIATQYLGIFGEIRTCNLALSPQLRTIRILSPLIVPEANGIQLHRLKELELRYCSSMAGCLQWVDKAPNLETLRVRFFTAEEQSLESETRVRRLEKLTNLEISSFSSDSDPAEFLRLLHIPNLTDLLVDTNDIIDGENWTCVIDLLRRSHPQALEALTLLGTPMRTEDISECLRLSPKLTYLNLGATSDEILHALSASTEQHSRSEEPLCPALEVLEITHMDNCSFESIVNLASSRCRDKCNDDSEPMAVNPDNQSPSATQSNSGFRTLETVIVAHDPDYTLLNHPDIIQCIKKGLDVVHRPGEFGLLPPSRTAAHLRAIGV